MGSSRRVGGYRLLRTLVKNVATAAPAFLNQSMTWMTAAAALWGFFTSHSTTPTTRRTRSVFLTSIADHLQSGLVGLLRGFRGLLLEFHQPLLAGAAGV